MSKALQNKLSNGGSMIVAEGYIFEFERRGYLKAGAFVPEVVLEHPELVKQLHEEFVHAGSDVVLAFTYYGHREKLRLIGRESDLERLNRKALSIAREVSRETGTLFAGNLSNTTHYVDGDEESKRVCRQMFKEQVEWSVEEGADFIVAETFTELGEAMLALEVIQEFGNGLPAVITLIPSSFDRTKDGVPLEEACRRLELAGAAVVGLNCGRGPATMLPIIEKVVKTCKGPVACLPNMYSTTEDQPTMNSLLDPFTGKPAFYANLCGKSCSRSEIEWFAQRCRELGVQYMGLCCGNAAHYTRAVAEVYGRCPPASRFSPDMSNHFMYGDKFTKYQRSYNDFHYPNHD